MNRRAFLIAVGKAKGEKEIPGVYGDFNATNAHLKGIPGGAWDSTELKYALDAPRSEVLSGIDWVSQADYALVLFAGHGCERYVEVVRGHRVPVTHMVCSDGELVSRIEITPRSPRRLVLMDCCRGLPVEETLESTVRGVVKLAEQFRPRTTRARARELFDAAVARAEEGSIYVYGCKLDGAASDNYSFTSVLTAAAAEWADRSAGVATIDKMFDFAKIAHSKLEPDQAPEIDGGRRRGWFPFAVGECET